MMKTLRISLALLLIAMTSSQVFGQKLKTQQLILENSTPNNVTLLPATGAFSNYTLALPANAAVVNNVLTVTGVIGPNVTTSWQSASGLVKAANGLSKSLGGDSIELGGTLYKPTTIALAGNNLALTGTGRLVVNGSGITLGSATDTTSSLNTRGTDGSFGQLLISRGSGNSPEWSSTLSGLTLNNTTLTGTTTINDGPVNINASTMNISSGTTTNWAGDVTYTSTSNVTFTTLPTIPLNENQILVGNASNIAAPFGPPTADQILISNGSGDVTWSNISSIVQARNGLNVNGGYVELGGPLTGPATITTGATNNVTFDGGGTVTISATGNGAGAGGLTLGTNTELNVGGSNGTSGQVLRSNGDGASPSWVSIGSLVQASNGLNKDGDTVQLGGVLNQPTTISTQAANNLNLDGAGAFSITATGNGAGAGGIVLGPNTDIFANGTVGNTDDILVSRGDGNSPQWKSLSSIIISGRVLATNSAVTQNVPVTGKLANQKVIITLENPNTTEAIIGYQLSGNGAGSFDVTFTAVPAVGTYINYVILP